MKKTCFMVLTVMVFISISLLTTSAEPLPGKTEAWKDLHEKAKKEGVVIFNTIMPDLEAYKPVIDAFEKRFPGVKVKLISTGGAETAPRIITEARARKISMDVARGGINGMIAVYERDLIAQYDWTGFGIPKGRIHMDGRNLDYIPGAWTIYYNSKFVSKAEAPRTWEDLLDPKWKGKICLHRASPNIPGLALAWGEKKWKAYIEKLAKQDVVPGVRSPDVLQKVTSGEVWIGNGGLHMILPARKKGSQIDITSISPHGDTDTDLVSFKGCPHPHAAKLFMAWSMIPEAEKALELTGYAFDAEKRQIIQDLGIKTVPMESIEDAKFANKMRGEFKKIMGFSAR